jgi:PhoPQ-activated pathogenicity-related protein
LNYSEDALNQLKQKYTELLSRYSDLAITVGAFTQSLKSERAREFMVHGVSRRLWMIYRCIVNIFRLFPPDQAKPLLSDDRLDVEINLHAFLINIYGTMENLGLAAGYESELIGKKSEGKIPRRQVSLFNEKFRRRLNKPLKEYLNQSGVDSWYREYAKNYRDALAHRVPPYVPPSALNDDEQQRYQAIEKEISTLYSTYDFDRIEALRNEQERLGRANPFFIHSFAERVRPLYLHAQVLVDFLTIQELVEVFVGAGRKNYHRDSMPGI